MNLLKYLLK